MGDEDYQFLDMFEASIGTATDRETVLFKEFNTASAQASDWLKNHRKLSRSTWTDDEVFESRNEQPLFVDKLLDIGQETDLLAETKDIRDELNMISTVFQHQQHVLADFQEAIAEIYHGQHRSQFEVKKRFKEQQRTIDMHLKDIARMDKQAERIYASITDLLDLKQKHANAFEARFASRPGRRNHAPGQDHHGLHHRHGHLPPAVVHHVDLQHRHRAVPARRTEPGGGGMVPMDRVLSAARSRHSFESQFGGSVLPTSTRDTVGRRGRRKGFGYGLTEWGYDS